MTAALRLLNRAKASSATKAKIKTCVLRKSKAMGCKTTKGDSLADTLLTDSAVRLEDLIPADALVAADAALETEEWADSIELLDFLEEDLGAIDRAHEVLADALTKGRQLTEDQQRQYRRRSLQSLADAMADDLQGEAR